MLRPLVGSLAGVLVLSVSAGAQEGGGGGVQDQPAPIRPGLVVQHRIIINPGDGEEPLPAGLQELLDDELELLLEREAMMVGELNARLQGRVGNGLDNQNRAVWINDPRLVQQGLGLTQFNRLDQIPRDELTADRVLDLLGWSGMSATQSDEPLDIGSWTNEQILSGLDDADAGMRRRVTRALALSERFDDGQLIALLQDEGLTLEQRARLLDVSFARFVSAPRAAVGASFNTGIPIQITGLFPAFPAAQQNLLQMNDELIEIEGQSLLHQNAFGIVRSTVLSRRAGETVTMVVRRPFAAEEVARIRLEREEARAARLAEEQAEAEARLAEARAEADALRNEANAPWEDDPVWQNIMRQMEILQAKNPDATMEITPEGDFLFAGQRLGNIAHLDGLFARGVRGAGGEPREPEPVDLELILTPGRTLTIEVPLGSLAELQRDGGGAGSPGLSDLHNAWKYRLMSLGIEASRVTADSVEVQTPELGWVQTNVGQRVTTLISAPRSSRQHQESSMAIVLAQRGGGRGGWNQNNVMIAEHWMPSQDADATKDTTAFRVRSTELVESEVLMRRDSAINEAASQFAALRDRRGVLRRWVSAQPTGSASEALQREIESIDRRLEYIERQMGVGVVR